MSTIIRVTGEHPSTITVGHGLGFEPIREALDEAVTKVLIVHARPLAARAEALAQYLNEQGIVASTADHPDAEAGKSIEVVSSLWDECGRLQLGRKDAIIAMGGGATTDMAGFVAATWLRGITLINVPTTLLAMVDAAVGGKTGINTSVGKNLVGSFYPAAAVVADMDLLESLPAPDLAAGAAEVIKCGFIADPAILRIVESTDPQELLRADSPQLAEVTTRAIAVKASVVSADLTEGGLREILNYGHTLAHAIERANDYTWRHGDAVAVGCCFAARLAHARGQLSAKDVARHDDLFSRVGLPTRYEGHTIKELTRIMLSDKKVRRGILRFVLLDGIAKPRTVSVDPSELMAPAEQIGIGA
ncbi:3-dehydroquinate synthase [Isoptericola variabilis]|uniref:3-dehydroquinate synthase n=1 Tax=Isoptericola variabilis TaxID=139208 RepID=UPI000660FBE0|nr:3-dehydroquinate synthase [Isoptericola variabilis]